jgi:hypothetical protein
MLFSGKNIMNCDQRAPRATYVALAELLAAGEVAVLGQKVVGLLEHGADVVLGDLLEEVGDRARPALEEQQEVQRAVGRKALLHLHGGDGRLEVEHEGALGEVVPEDGVVAGRRLDVGVGRLRGEVREEVVRDEARLGEDAAVDRDRRGLADRGDILERVGAAALGRAVVDLDVVGEAEFLGSVRTRGEGRGERAWRG